MGGPEDFDWRLWNKHWHVAATLWSAHRPAQQNICPSATRCFCVCTNHLSAPPSAAGLWIRRTKRRARSSKEAAVRTSPPPRSATFLCLPTVQVRTPVCGADTTHLLSATAATPLHHPPFAPSFQPPPTPAPCHQREALWLKREEVDGVFLYLLKRCHRVPPPPPTTSAAAGLFEECVLP